MALCIFINYLYTVVSVLSTVRDGIYVCTCTLYVVHFFHDANGWSGANPQNYNSVAQP